VAVPNGTTAGAAAAQLRTLVPAHLGAQPHLRAPVPFPYPPYLDRCASISISIMNSGSASPLTSSQLPVGNCFV
jgi:hypothetical protein